MGDTLHKPAVGLLTFDAEGNNNPDSRYFSRRAHAPTLNSGVTIGRGYDMKHRSKEAILKDFELAGIAPDDRKKLAEGSKLTGEEAKAFVNKAEIKAIIISEEAQKKLFEIVYPLYYKKARVICEKAHLEKVSYGKCKWVNMDNKVKELIADLIYRGDYSKASREKIQQALVAGDPAKIKEALDKLSNVPLDRQLSRKKHLK